VISFRQGQMNSSFKNNVLLEQLTLALLVFIFSQCVLAVVLKYCDFGYFSSLNWIRWDSAHYLGIAEKGYEFFPCAGRFGYPLDSKDMCGNTAWFPGYSMVLRFLGLFFGDLILVGGIVSKFFYFLILFLVLRLAEMNVVSFRNFLFLSIAAFNFGFIYYNAIFPISGLVFCGLASYYFFQKKNIWLSALFCFLSSFFYTTGFLVTVILWLFILLKLEGSLKQILQKAAIIGISGLLGFLAVFLLIQVYVGDWGAFMQVQAKYGNGTVHNPFASMTSYIKKGLEVFSLENFKYYQTLFVAFMYLLLTVFFLFKRFYKNNLYTWSYLSVTIFLFFPWIMGGDVSFYRSEALLLPFVFVLKEAKTAWLAGILAVMVVLGIFMSRLFFLNILV